MATILMGWITGTGLGHITKLVPLAHVLRDQGHDVVLAVQKFRYVVEYLRSEGLTAIPAFGVSSTGRRPPPLRSFANILDYNGFSDPEQLNAEVFAWDGILAQVRPDLVVTESAFSLLLACYDRLPVVQIGTGLTVPPHHFESFPRFDVPEELVDTSDLLEVISGVQQRVGRNTPPNVPALFEGPRAIYGVRELDVHGHSRLPEEYGRPTSLEMKPRAHEPSTPKVFAYLRSTYEGLPGIIGAIGRLGVPTELVCRGLPEALAQLAGHHGIVVHEEPQDLATTLPRVSLLVHHGGQGTAHAGLLIGCPQLIVATQGEQWRNAGLLEQLGVAGWVSGEKEQVQSRVEPVLQKIWGELGAYAARAQEAATEITKREHETAHDHALALIDPLL